MKAVFLAIGLLGVLFAGSQTLSASVITVAPGSLTECPAVGSAPSCAVVYRFNADGSIDTLVDPTIPSTDGIEDTLAGVQNLTSSALPSLTLSGTGIGGVGIFAFDGDGQSAIGCPSGSPGNTYCGQFDATAPGARDGVNSFSGINGSGTLGTVVFGAGGVVAGGSGWFVLEDQISFTAPPPVGGGVPEPGTTALVAIGIAGLAFGRRAILP